MTLIIRPATIQDALRIAPLIRPEDVEEWIALAPLHKSPGIAASLVYSVEHGEAWYGEEHGGEPIAIGGLCPARFFNGTESQASSSPLPFALPWMMATPAVARHGTAILREGRKTLRKWQERGLPLRNIVSAKHRRAVRFIRACGYEILFPFYMHGEQFFLFGTGGG
jgi:hypothetical protein